MARRSRGEGTVFWSDAEQRWVAQITLPNGKKKSKLSKTQSEARKWLLEQRKAVQDNVYLTDESYTVSNFMDRYFADVAEHTLAPRTVLSYMNMRKHIEPALGNVKLSQLRVDHLQKLYSDKLVEGLSRRTVQYIHQFLHTVLNVAVKWGLLIRNVADLADAPSQEKEPATILTAPQVKQLLEIVKGTKFYALYMTAITLGLREGELLALTWGDVDFDHRRIQINKQLQYIPGEGLSVKMPKTKTSVRNLPLPEITCTALQNLFRDDPKKVGLIFHTSADTPYSPRNILRHFHGLLKKMDLPIMPFHNLRHTCASFHLAAGTNPKVVQEILGHSSVSVTLSVYSHLLPGVGEEAAGRMNKVFE